MAKAVDFTFKILMLGSASTGKTSLSDRYVNGIFDPSVKLTVGVEFYIKNIELMDRKGELKKIKLQIWDLGGEARFRFLLPTYCLGSSGAFFLFDITRPETLLTLDSWTAIVKEKNGNIPIILTGNKIDLENKRKIPREHGIQTAMQNGLIEYIEVSAKTGQNVENLFQKLAYYMLDHVYSTLR